MKDSVAKKMKQVPVAYPARRVDPHQKKHAAVTIDRNVANLACGAALLAGLLGLTDMTVDGGLPEDVQTLLAWVICVAGAGTSGDYIAILRVAGFTDVTVEDRRQDLLDMTDLVRRRLVGVELAIKLGKSRLGELDLREGKQLAHRFFALIARGVTGYALITATEG